jgi:hypothetical protein
MSEERVRRLEWALLMGRMRTLQQCLSFQLPFSVQSNSVAQQSLMCHLPSPCPAVPLKFVPPVLPLFYRYRGARIPVPIVWWRPSTGPVPLKGVSDWELQVVWGTSLGGHLGRFGAFGVLSGCAPYLNVIHPGRFLPHHRPPSSIAHELWSTLHNSAPTRPLRT